MRSELFRIFKLPVKSYGLMLVIGFALGIWRAVRVSKKRYGIAPERVYDIALVVLFSSILSARLVYVILDHVPWDEFLAVWDGGLSFHGGMAATLLVGVVYTRLAKLSYWDCADLVAPSLALGYACTRIGCFLNGCCHGAPTDLPWGVRFTEGSFTTPSSHPTQIYASLANIVIFLLLAKTERMRRPRGFVFAAYVGLYGVYRFLIEFVRAGYSADYWYLGLTQAQWVSIAMIAISAITVAILARRKSPVSPE